MCLGGVRPQLAAVMHPRVCFARIVPFGAQQQPHHNSFPRFPHPRV